MMFPWEVTQSVVKQPNDLVVSVASDECCQGKWIIAAGNRTFIFLWVHFHPAKVRKKNPTIKNDFIFSKGGGTCKPHSFDLFARKWENFYVYALFFIVHTPDSVTFYIPHWSCLCVWTGRKGIWRIKKRILQPLAT